MGTEIDPATAMEAGAATRSGLGPPNSANATVPRASFIVVHGSSLNMSPWPRLIFSLILNPASNALTCHQRPDYHHHRDLTPVAPVPDDCLDGEP